MLEHRHFNNADPDSKLPSLLDPDLNQQGQTVYIDANWLTLWYETNRQSDKQNYIDNHTNKYTERISDGNKKEIKSAKWHTNNFIIKEV